MVDSLATFSSRLDWDLRPNAISQALAAKNRSEILDLTESNPTRAGFRFDAEEILAGFADPRALVYDPASRGTVEARELIASYHGVSIDRVLLTSSTSEAYSWLFKLLANPGEEILAPRPSYPLFDFLAALEAVRVVHYPLVYHGGWSIDFERLREAITPLTRAIVVVNPNNPTGSYVKADEYVQLAEIARERNIALISDEVFSSYRLASDTGAVTSLVDRQGALTFCLNGLSKLLGLPQMKLGWIVAGGPRTARDAALDRLELIADTYLSVGTPVQCALPKLLGIREDIQAQILARLRRNHALLAEAVRDSPFSLLRVEGGWYATLRAPKIRSEEQWTLNLLREHDVLVQPGFFYDFEDEAFLIISLLTPEGTFSEGVRRILEWRG